MSRIKNIYIITHNIYKTIDNIIIKYSTQNIVVSQDVFKNLEFFNILLSQLEMYIHA